MPHRDIVVIGGSAGGFPALREIVAGLPSDLESSVFVAVHSSNGAEEWQRRLA